MAIREDERLARELPEPPEPLETGHRVGSGHVIFPAPPRNRHRCRTPGWWATRAYGDGAVFACGCGKKYVLDRTSTNPANTRMIVNGADHWPWIDHVDNYGPPPKPVRITPPDSKGIVYGRGKAPTKAPRGVGS